MANKEEQWSIVTETGAFGDWNEIEDGSATPIKKKKSIEEIIKEAEEANKRNL